jgi:hypothetical protein
LDYKGRKLVRVSFFCVVLLVVSDDFYFDDAALVDFQNVEGEVFVIDAFSLDGEFSFYLKE